MGTVGLSSNGAEHWGQSSKQMYEGTIMRQRVGGERYPMMENAHGGDRGYIGPVSPGSPVNE